VGKMLLTHREGLVMYWCEGDRSEKSRTYRAALTSSDPRILKLFVEWLEQYYGTKKAQMKVRLHLWPDVDEKLQGFLVNKSRGTSTKLHEILDKA
jgi:hypothetical protein